MPFIHSELYKEQFAISKENADTAVSFGRIKVFYLPTGAQENYFNP